jgi:hypothetical protein
VPYSAGTVFLQVVPSYQGFQEANKRQARDIANALDKGLDEGTKSGAAKAKKNIDDVLGKAGGEAGEKAAKDYAGKFRTELSNSLKGLSREIEPIQLRTDNHQLLDAFEKAKAEAKALSKLKITPGMDTSEIESRATFVRALLKQIDQDADVRVKMDISAATGPIDRLDAALTKLKKSANIDVDVNTQTFERKIGYLEKTLRDKLGRATEALGDGVSEQLDKIKLQMQTLRDKRIGVDISADDAIRDARDLQHHLEFLAAMDPNIQVHLDAKKASAELKAFQLELTKVDRRDVKPEVKLRGADETSKKISLLDRLFGKLGVDGRDVANSFRFFSFAALGAAGAGAALIPVVAALTGAFIALGVALGGLLVGAGILGLAFSGIGDAVGALNDAQDNAAKDAEANSKKMRNAARQVADAERSLRRAREDSAQAAKDAAQSVADAEDQAARALEDSLRRQQDAQNRYNETVHNSIQAQKDLVQARKDAVKELDDLDNKRKRNALDERQAVIDLFNATVANNAAQADPGATNLEKEQASINLGDAQLRLKEIREQGKELKDQQAQGIDGSDKVKTAQDRVTDALKAQKEAQRDLADSDRELARTRLDNARSIQDALEAQRRTIADNAQRTEDAQRNLVEAQEDYRTALTETGEIGSSSLQKVNDAMSKLSPAGREFALFIHGLRDDFLEIRSIVQEGLLPGVQKAIQILIDTYGPGFKSFVGEVSELLGTLAVEGAKVFTSPAWKNFFSTMASLTPKVIELFFRSLTNWMTVFANLAVAFAPLALEISGYLLGISEAVLEWTESEEGQKMIQEFLGYLRDVGPQVAEFLLALAQAFVAIVQALAPYGEMLLGVLTGFLNWIAGMDPQTLATLLIGILGLVTAFQALAGIITVLSIVAGSTLGPIVVAIFAIIGALVYFYNTNENVKKIIDTVWKALKEAADLVFPVIAMAVEGLAAGIVVMGQGWALIWNKVLWPVLKAIGDVIGQLWNDIAKPIFTLLGKFIADTFTAIGWSWTYILWPVLKNIGLIFYNIFVLAIKPALELVGTVFGKLWEGIVWVWDHTGGPLLKAIAKALGVDDSGKEGKGGLVGAFKSAIGFIGKIWDGLKDLAKKPIDFVVGTVLNKGLIAGFNKLVGKLPGVKELQPIPWPPPGFASGGIPDSTYGVRPGYMPGRDNQIIAVGGGEAILRPELTAALGSNWVYAANKRAKRGGIQGAMQFLQGYYEGGVIDSGNRRATPGDWEVTRYQGKKIDWYTLRMLQAAERMVNHAFTITQGSYSTSVAASGSTHAGGGALDLGWTWKDSDVAALRMAGFAAWHRNPLQGPWRDHIHAIAIGDIMASAAAKRQVQDYFNGGNGLGGKDDGPNVKKDPGLWEKIKGKGGDILGDIAGAIAAPAEWLLSQVQDKLDAVTKAWGDNTFTQIITGVPKKLIETLSGVINAFGNIGGSGDVPAGGVKAMVQRLAATFGWGDGAQWAAIDWIVGKESGWRPDADNPNSTAYGLFQLLQGTAAAYGGQSSDPGIQAQQGLRYIKERYGDPVSAKAFWEAHNWYHDGGVVPMADGSTVADNGTMMYDNGGYLPPGVTTVVNLTGKPEPVFTAAQFEGMRSGNPNGGGVHYEPHFYNSDLTADDVMDDFRFELRRLGRGS